MAIYDQFRIFYSLSGNDQLPSQRRLDRNKNDIPDFIENIGERLIQANTFFKNEVGLKPPLQSNRYAGYAQAIDVNILDFSNNNKGPRNGIAYDGTPKFNRTIARTASLSVLAIDISSTVKLGSNTVEHELFHLYQNGYTYFKNRWYTEGTARWSELVVRGKLGIGQKLPKTTREKELLFKKSYDAHPFWNALILGLDKDKLGKRFIKELLQQLDHFDDVAAKSRGISNRNWKESEQRSDKNNPFIWQALVNTSKRFAATAEVGNLSRL
ncbi:MAG: hypothetical protein AB8B79_07365 [Granulosicoccus sp.]